MRCGPHTLSEGPTELGAVIESQLLQALRSSLPQGENTGFVLAAHDDQGALTGGLVAGTSYGWLLTKCLWVADAYRGQGLGRALMAQAEDKARRLGCHSAWLDTSSPAAQAFYLQLGYQAFGELANRPGQALPNHRRWFLRKDL